MNQLKYLLLSILCILIFVGGYYLGKNKGESPVVLFQASEADDNLVKWKNKSNEIGTSLISASVVSQTDTQLVLYVEYIYSGSHGRTATTCGSVMDRNDSWVWGCAPTGIGTGRGFASLRFTLNNRARNVECSDEIKINFYDGKGVTFFSKRLPYNKKWFKASNGKDDKLPNLVSACPKQPFKSSK